MPRYVSLLLLAACCHVATAQDLGKLREKFAWKQLTYNIDGVSVLQDRFGGTSEDEPSEETRTRRQAADNIVFNNNDDEDTRNNSFATVPDSRKFFIQYNNVPMGVERWRNKIFVTVPRRRYGIPSTLNYIDLKLDGGNKSPGLRPYPSLRRGRGLVSVYRTRVDSCDRLWMVDTGVLEIPDNTQQIQPPAIVVFDLKTDRQIFRYQLKDTDLVNNRTAAGFASITVDVGRACGDAFAYITDLATYGLVVYSLRHNNSWRVTHNFFSFSPVAGNLNIADQQFQWNDGIFSITLSRPDADGFRTAYFHPMVSFQEFAVSTRVLRNRTAALREYHGEDFKSLGERGPNSQSTMHGLHAATGAIFYADVGRDALSCWNTALPLSPDNIATLAQDHTRLVYPSDLHVTGDEVWMMVNALPRFIYSQLNTSEYNFKIYTGSVNELIAGTKCEPAGGSSYSG